MNDGDKDKRIHDLEEENHNLTVRLEQYEYQPLELSTRVESWGDYFRWYYFGPTTLFDVFQLSSRTYTIEEIVDRLVGVLSHSGVQFDHEEYSYSLSWLQVSETETRTFIFLGVTSGLDLANSIQQYADQLYFLPGATESYMMLTQGTKLLEPSFVPLPTARFSSHASAPIEQEKTASKSWAPSVGSSESPFFEKVILRVSPQILPFRVYISSRFYGSYSWTRSPSQNVEKYLTPAYNRWSW